MVVNLELLNVSILRKLHQFLYKLILKLLPPLIIIQFFLTLLQDETVFHNLHALGFLLGHQLGFVEALNIDNIHGMFSILVKLSSRKVTMN